MKKRSLFKTVIVAALTVAVVAVLAGCASNSSSSSTSASTSSSSSAASTSEVSYTIAVPSDPTNEARALLLLQDQGLITLDSNAGLTATPKDITSNPYNIDFVEVEAAAVPSTLDDVDYGIINGNYAISAGLDTQNTVISESTDSDAAEVYANVVAIRPDEENSPKIQALVSALETQTVKDFIDSSYDGSVVTVFEPNDGSAIPQATGDDTTIKVGASPTPHAEILEQIKPLLQQKGWDLQVVEFSDYIQPNQALENGELDANYFQHITYLNDYNQENGTSLVSAAEIHFEPLGLYAGGKISEDRDIKALIADRAETGN